MPATREDVLRKLQAILDKAASTTFDAERDALLAKADEMMAKFAIEEFELSMRSDSRAGRISPEVRQFSVGAEVSDWEVRHSMDSMFVSLTRLLGCRLGATGFDRGGTLYSIVGYPSDLDYLGMLWLSLQFHFLSTMDPKPDASKSDLDNFIALWEAGNDYRSIWRKMDWPWETNEKDWDGRSVGGSGDLVASERKRLHALRRGYHERCEAEGRKPLKGLKAETYRNSFLQGYAHRIARRIEEMKAVREEASKGHEIVLVTMKSDLTEFFYEMWPEARPHPAECECDNCHFMKCSGRECSRPRCKEYWKNADKPVRYRAPREEKIQADAYNRGSSVANDADLGTGKVGGAPKGEVG